PINSQHPSVRYRSYRTDNPKGTCEVGITAGQQGKGKVGMVSLILITAAGALAVGIIVGIVFMTSRGIKREQKRYEEARRFREERGPGPDREAGGPSLPGGPGEGGAFVAPPLKALSARPLPTAPR